MVFVVEYLLDVRTYQIGNISFEGMRWCVDNGRFSSEIRNKSWLYVSLSECLCNFHIVLWFYQTFFGLIIFSFLCGMLTLILTRWIARKVCQYTSISMTEISHNRVNIIIRSDDLRRGAPQNNQSKYRYEQHYTCICDSTVCHFVNTQNYWMVWCLCGLHKTNETPGLWIFHALSILDFPLGCFEQ